MERPWAPARPGLSLLLTITAGLNLLPFAALLAFSLQGSNGVLDIGNDGLTQLSNTVLL
ncbi:MAG: iron ABC transporter permease, partial [Synechococcus sp.]|nr:iron ABC transporter permease [Synechococcus sp.]